MHYAQFIQDTTHIDSLAQCICNGIFFKATHSILEKSSHYAFLRIISYHFEIANIHICVHARHAYCCECLDIGIEFEMSGIWVCFVWLFKIFKKFSISTDNAISNLEIITICDIIDMHSNCLCTLYISCAILISCCKNADFAHVRILLYIFVFLSIYYWPVVHFSLWNPIMYRIKFWNDWQHLFWFWKRKELMCSLNLALKTTYWNIKKYIETMFFANSSGKHFCFWERKATHALSQRKDITCSYMYISLSYTIFSMSPLVICVSLLFCEH